jgi:hypothetical protein
MSVPLSLFSKEVAQFILDHDTNYGGYAPQFLTDKYTTDDEDASMSAILYIYIDQNILASTYSDRVMSVIASMTLLSTDVGKRFIQSYPKFKRTVFDRFLVFINDSKVTSTDRRTLTRLFNDIFGFQLFEIPYYPDFNGLSDSFIDGYMEHNILNPYWPKEI